MTVRPLGFLVWPSLPAVNPSLPLTDNGLPDRRRFQGSECVLTWRPRKCFSTSRRIGRYVHNFLFLENGKGQSTARSIVGGFWMIDANFKSSIYLKNDLKIAPLTVTPILYLSNGKRYALATQCIA
jgi:hypothetical protein